MDGRTTDRDDSLILDFLLHLPPLGGSPDLSLCGQFIFHIRLFMEFPGGRGNFSALKERKRGRGRYPQWAAWGAGGPLNIVFWELLWNGRPSVNEDQLGWIYSSSFRVTSWTVPSFLCQYCWCCCWWYFCWWWLRIKVAVSPELFIAYFIAIAVNFTTVRERGERTTKRMTIVWWWSLGC